MFYVNQKPSFLMCQVTEFSGQEGGVPIRIQVGCIGKEDGVKIIERERDKRRCYPKDIFLRLRIHRGHRKGTKADNNNCVYAIYFHIRFTLPASQFSGERFFF